MNSPSDIRNKIRQADLVNERRFVRICLLLMAVALIGWGLGGCSTLIPKDTVPQTPSFDVGGQNSGFLGFTNIPGHGPMGIITPHARDRYNALVSTYSGRFIPRLLPDLGLAQIPAQPNWLISPQALVNFETMNRWRKEKR